MFAARPESGVRFEDMTIPGKDGHQIPVRLYQPDDQDPGAPMMAYWHMGGGVVLNVEACHAHLATPEGQVCMTGGCLARLSCPVSARAGRDPDQSAHHMRAFHPS